MNIEPQSYIVANLHGKDCLIRVTNYNKGNGEGFYEHGEEEEPVSFSEEDVQAILTPKPNVGRVYGATTERLIDVSETEKLEIPLYWYFHAEDKVRENISKHIDSAVKVLKKNGLGYTLDWFKVRILFNKAKNLTSRTAIGTYKVTRGEEPDVLTIKYHPDSLSETERLFFHEVGHGIWNRKLPSKAKVRWLTVYASLQEVENISTKRCMEVARRMIEEESLVVVGDNEVDTEIADYIVETIEGLYGIRRSDLWLLLETGSPLAIDLITKTAEGLAFTRQTNPRETHVSEYANNMNAEELFCEALANHLSGLKTPKYLNKLMEKTLEYIKA